MYGKGWEELLALLDYHQRHNKNKQTSHPTIDAYGSGEASETVSNSIIDNVCQDTFATFCEADASNVHVAACACMQVKSKAEKLKLSINFLGRKDHLDPVIQDYQVSAGAFT